MCKKKTRKAYRCFFCGKVFSEKGVEKHYAYGMDEFPVCINGKKQ